MGSSFWYCYGEKDDFGWHMIWVSKGAVIIVSFRSVLRVIIESNDQITNNAASAQLLPEGGMHDEILPGFMASKTKPIIFLHFDQSPEQLVDTQSNI